jgi:hypothetical protein
MTIAVLTVKLHGRLGQEIAILKAIKRKQVEWLTLILLTLTETPGTEIGRLHPYASSMLTVVSIS